MSVKFKVGKEYQYTYQGVNETFRFTVTKIEKENRETKIRDTWTKGDDYSLFAPCNPYTVTVCEATRILESKDENGNIKEVIFTFSFESGFPMFEKSVNA